MVMHTNGVPLDQTPLDQDSTDVIKPLDRDAYWHCSWSIKLNLAGLLGLDWEGAKTLLGLWFKT